MRTGKEKRSTEFNSKSNVVRDVLVFGVVAAGLPVPGTFLLNEMLWNSGKGSFARVRVHLEAAICNAKIIYCGREIGDL